MKRSALVLVLTAGFVLATASQTIDKPAATLKLTKQELVSVRQFKADVDRIETVTGSKLTVDQRRQVLDGKVNSLLFFQYCDREKIYATEADITAAIAQMKNSLGAGADDAKLEAALRSQGVFNDVRTYVKQQLLFRGYLTTKRASELSALKAPTSDEVLKAYDLAKASLVRPDTVRISVVFIDLRGLSADARAKASESFRTMASQLKSNPGRFDEMMIKASDKGSGYKASPSIYVSKTSQYQDLYGAAFMDKAFRLKLDEVSDLIENEAGLQILRINEILPQKQLTLSDTVPGQQGTVQELITQQLVTDRQTKLLDGIEKELVASLRKEATVRIYDENLVF